MIRVRDYPDTDQLLAAVIVRLRADGQADLTAPALSAVSFRAAEIVAQVGLFEHLTEDARPGVFILRTLGGDHGRALPGGPLARSPDG